MTSSGQLVFSRGMQCYIFNCAIAILAQRRNKTTKFSMKKKTVIAVSMARRKTSTCRACATTHCASPFYCFIEDTFDRI